MKDFRILLKNLRPYAGLFALAFTLTASVAVFEAGRTALLKSIIDGMPGSGAITTTGHAAGSAMPLAGSLAAKVDVRTYIPARKNPWPIIAALLVIFTFISGLSEYLSSVLMWRIGVSVVVNLREKLYNHILKQSAEFFSRYPTNSLTSHIISDAKEVQVAVSTLLADLLREGLTFLALFCLVLVYNWRLTLIALGMGPLIYLLTVRFGKKLRRIANSTQEGMEEVLDIAQETISGNRIVKAFGMEKFEQGR